MSKERISLFHDLTRNLRESEDSRIVASKWGNATDPYLSEIPDASNTQYFNLTAERLLYRNKLLSLPIDQALAECEAIQSARPFGERGPNFDMLRDASVRMAMAFVPLTPTSENGKPVMARLYCVIGLPAVYQPPFLEGVDEPGIDSCSWFVAGVPAVFKGEVLSGRSWLLAANLLMKVVENGDCATARNLTTAFITTGDVESGNIREVEMGRKPELAEIKEYRNYKWIVPMKNENEMNNVPSRVIEKPATLEEAYKLIETMQNKATRSFFRFLKESNLEGVKEQFEIGADIYASDEDSGESPLQIANKNVLAAITKVSKAANSLDSREKASAGRCLVNCCSMMDWLITKAANCTVLFYDLAMSGMGDALATCARKFPINARDAFGRTAIDWALMAGDWAAAKLLHANGGECKTNYVSCDSYRWLENAINQSGSSPEQLQRLETAMEVGLSPNVVVDLRVPDDAWLWSSDADVELPKRCSLFGLALLKLNATLVKLCLDNGANPDTVIEIEEDDPSYGWIKARYSCALELLYCRYAWKYRDFADDKIMAISTLLKEYGARETPSAVAAREQFEISVVLKDDVKRHDMYLEALKRLSSGKDNEQNHALIIECLRRGESMYANVEAMTEDDMGNYLDVNSSLWGMSIYFGWCDIVKECLNKGVNLNDEIIYERISFPEGLKEGLWMKKSPVEVVKWNNYADGRIKDQLLELLKGNT